MRLKDIKFKAKRLDNGEWVVGDLLHSYEGGAIIVPITDKGEHGGAFTVNPSTVCQYTGLKDKDGKEIWEHDLVGSHCGEQEIIFKYGTFEISYYSKIVSTTIEKPLILFLSTEGNVECEIIGSKFDKLEGK